MACCLMLCARWRSVSLHQLLNPPRRELTAAGVARAAAGSRATAEAAVEVEAAADGAGTWIGQPPWKNTGMTADVAIEVPVGGRFLHRLSEHCRQRPGSSTSTQYL
jgi:hypothetical protein